MKIIHGSPPSYRDAIANMNITNTRARRALENGFPVAVESHCDDIRNPRVYTVCTPYGERSPMTLMGIDVPRRISNMCPVIQDETLMSRDPSTPSELLGQFFIDPTRVAAYVANRNIEPYDYADKAMNELASLWGRYVDDTHETMERRSTFDCIQRLSTSVFSYDIPTPRIGRDGADDVILTGDLAHLWKWSRMAKMPLQESMKEVFCDAIGAKEGGSFEERLRSSMKRIRDVPLFHVTDVTRQGMDFTQMTRTAVLTMKSIPCMLNDMYLRQANKAMSVVYPVNEIPIVPQSIFHAVGDDYRDGCVDGQVAQLHRLVEGNYRDLNNVLKMVRESKQRLAGSVSYHRHLLCARCGQDTTSLFTICEEVTETLSHKDDGSGCSCDGLVQNAGKFVTIQTKGNRRTFSLDCCRQVRRVCKGMPQYDKGDDRIGLFTEDQAKQIFERPCVIADCLQPMMRPDIGNQRGKYDNLSATVYVLVPFDRRATLEYLETEEGVAMPQADLLTIHNTVECVVPLLTTTEGLTEYRFEALAFRGKLTISVQAYGTTSIGRIPLFDPEATTKRLCLEMLDEDGRVKLHEYQHQLEYNQKRYMKTQGTMISITNFKRYKAPEKQDVVPIEMRTNWDEYGYTLVGALAANLILSARYGVRWLLSPFQFLFGIVCNTREQEDRAEKRLRKREDQKRKHDSLEPNWQRLQKEMEDELERLKGALETERHQTTQLSDQLNLAQLQLEYYEVVGQQDKRQIEQLTKTNEAILRDFKALKVAKEEQIQELETHVATLTRQLHDAQQQQQQQQRRHRRRTKKIRYCGAEARAGTGTGTGGGAGVGGSRGIGGIGIGNGIVSWVDGWETTVIAV